MIFKEGPNNIFLARTSDRAWRAGQSRIARCFRAGRGWLKHGGLWFLPCTLARNHFMI